MQVGYLKCGIPAPTGCYNVPMDGHIHFVYTEVDNCGGCYKLADTWYGAAPIVGHRYRFTITQHIAPNQWKFCIRDISTGQSNVCTTRVASFLNANLAWWGTETQNENSGLGPLWTDRIHMYWMQYNVDNDPTWYVTTDDVITTNGGPFPSWYDCFVYNQNYTKDAFESVTHISSGFTCP